jgi:hypothetical protein
VMLTLETPGNVSGVYRVDNLRVRSAARQPPGAGQSVDVIAIKSYSPASDMPGETHFTVGAVQVPRAFHVKTGRSSGGSTRLELGFGSTASVTCVYEAGPGGTSYDFRSCDGDVLAGDILAADFARLTILGGDATAGPTKIRAQLAMNVLGDTLGRGLIPPMPTFWGESPDESNQIINAYSAELNAPPAPRGVYVTFPVPDFALRHGDGSGRNLLDPNSPPPPNDPPFDEEGHMDEKGSNWDAYWRLTGNLTASDANQRHTTHLEAQLGANVVVWGNDLNVLRIESSIDTDNGLVTIDHFDSPSATGSARVFLFGTELPDGGSRSATTGFNFNIGQTITYDAPPFPVWFFEIQVGLFGTAGLTASGALALDGFQASLTPSLVLGGHVFGGVNFGVVSGGVDVTVQFIDMAVPMTASAKWHVSTAPGFCAATSDYLLDAHAQIGTLGGTVDLVATIGVCPLCDTERLNIYGWKPKPITDDELFHHVQTAELFRLPTSLCRRPLTASIQDPSSGETVNSGVLFPLEGSATRPAPLVSGSSVSVPSTVDCSFLTWTSNNSTDSGFPATGCHPSVTFGDPGSRTITLTATNAFGETGSTSRSFVVADPPPGAIPFIISPHNGDVIDLHSGPVHLEGGSTFGTAPVVLSWTAVDEMTGFTENIGQGASLDWAGFAGTLTLTLTATDADGRSNSTSIHVTTVLIK